MLQGNTGATGIAQFFSSHKCNDICLNLGLSSPMGQYKVICFYLSSSHLTLPLSPAYFQFILIISVVIGGAILG